MKTISIRERHRQTGAWVRRAAEQGSITVTERGRPIARLEAIADPGAKNPFLTRKLLPAYAKLRTMEGLPNAISVRSADALHLACAREHGLRDVYTSDRHLMAAAPHFHVRAIAVGP